MRFLDYVSINPKISLEKERIYPFVEMGDVSTSFRNPDKVEYKSFDSGVKFADGDTVIARITPCLQNGKRFYCKNIGKGFGSTEYLVFRPKDSSVDNLYLYYFMNTDFIKESMVRSMVGATGRQRVNNDVFSRLDVTFPNIEIQRRIAEILSTYDDLIENNRKQIKLLEEAAQRLYKEWFVDLRFPGHENTKITDGIPEGWTRCALGDLIDFNPKVSLSKERKKQSVPMSALSTSSMTLDMAEGYTTESNAGSKFQNGDTLLARITPCLENGKTAFVAGIEAQEGAVGSTEFIVMRSRRLNPYMVYLLARTDDFRNSAINSMTGSDGRQRAQVDKLQALPHLEPPREIIDTFEKNIAPLFLQIRRKNEMNWHLREARDLLLPKLMSGKIEV